MAFFSFGMGSRAQSAFSLSKNHKKQGEREEIEFLPFLKMLFNVYTE